MSEISIAASSIRPRAKISAHRVLVTTAIAIAVLVVLAIAAYGSDYYWLSLSERPFSPKHFLLKPSGKIGVSLGLLGFSLFLVIFLYPLRKRIKWLAMRGSARHWLDFHIVAGCVAPIVIMFHASFKFQGFAGLAFWCMVAVALSGIVGRYLYAQIPPTLASTENLLREIEDTQWPSGAGSGGGVADLANATQRLFRIPPAEDIKRMPAISCVGYMIWLDIATPWAVARLRAEAAQRAGAFGTLIGLVPSRNLELENAIRSARHRGALAKRVAFLSKTQQVFQLWHVVHRPFSYSFAVLAIIHLVVVFALGYL